MFDRSIEIDSSFARAVKACFKIGHELFGLEELAAKRLISSANCRATIKSLRKQLTAIEECLNELEQHNS